MTNVSENKTIYQIGSRNYVKINLIGVGGFASVYLVEEEISREK